MRVVLPWTSEANQAQLARMRSDRMDSILYYGPEAVLRTRAGVNTYAEIAEQYPRDWRPDAFVWWSPEYNAVPRDLENADCLTVGVFGDWNLGGQALQLIGGLFDVLIADGPGTERLRSLGFPRVNEAALWCYDPAIHRRLPAVERDIDILLIGNLNHDVQRARAPWLARVARLATRYRVLITCGVYGEEYTRLMNRAKIVFNRSIRGEINMRAYEAPACGALLFYERENALIQSILRDRQECVLYGDDNLEDLLDYYLTHEDERNAIAEAGHQAIQGHTQARVLADVLEIVEHELRAGLMSNRTFRRLDSNEQRMRRARHWALTMYRSAIGAALSELSQMNPEQRSKPAALNARACLLAEQAREAATSDQRGHLLNEAADLLAEAVRQRGTFAAAWFNLAQVRLLQGSSAQAARALVEAIRILLTADPSSDNLDGPYLPRAYDLASVELESIWTSSKAGSEAWAASVRRLLLWRSWEGLSDVAHASGMHAEAAVFAERAVELYPDFGATRYRLAQAYHHLGRRAEAEREYRRALQDAPLCASIWVGLHRLLLESGDVRGAEAFRQDCETVIASMPTYQWVRGEFAAAAAKVQHAA